MHPLDAFHGLRSRLITMRATVALVVEMPIGLLTSEPLSPFQDAGFTGVGRWLSANTSRYISLARLIQFLLVQIAHRFLQWYMPCKSATTGGLMMMTFLASLSGPQSCSEIVSGLRRESALSQEAGDLEGKTKMVPNDIAC